MNFLQSSLKNPLKMTILNTFNAGSAGFKTVTHCVFDMDGLLLGNYCETWEKSKWQFFINRIAIWSFNVGKLRFWLDFNQRILFLIVD